VARSRWFALAGTAPLPVLSSPRTRHG
jgi:hypothetical protein